MDQDLILSILFSTAQKGIGDTKAKKTRMLPWRNEGSGMGKWLQGIIVLNSVLIIDCNISRIACKSFMLFLQSFGHTFLFIKKILGSVMFRALFFLYTELLKNTSCTKYCK
jgi:hypothetical protein